MAASWEASLSDNEQNTLRMYKRVSENLNRLLRTDAVLPQDMETRRREMDRILRRGKITENITVYRGINERVVNEVLRPFSVVQDKGFLSTTGDRAIAQDFANEHGATQRGYIVSISVRRGSRGMYMDADPQGRREYSGETEFLFPRNSRLRIQRINDVDRTIEAILEQEN